MATPRRGEAGAIYASMLAASGGSGAEEIVRATGYGLLVASGLALLGAITSATRPGRSQLEQ